MSRTTNQSWFVATLLLSCVTILALIFSLWELLEHRYFRDLDYSTLHYLYITRGIASSLLLALWAAWFVFRERRRHEVELERSREYYRSILRNTPDAVVLLDERFRVREWNPAAERLYGYKQGQVLGQVLPTVPEDLWPELEELLARVRARRNVLDHETFRCTATGERIPVAVSFSRMPQSHEHDSFFVEVAQDIAPRLRLRDKLLEVEKLALIGMMAAGTAHHLNTPLTAMLLQVEMLRQRVQGSEEEAELASIEKRIRFCQVFVENVLRFAQRSRRKHQPVGLCELLDGLETLFRPNLKIKKSSIRTDLSGLAMSQVPGDPNRLEAMFSALVSNAVDAAPAESVIRIGGRLNGRGQVEVHIDDTGPGLPEEAHSKLFEPFYTTKPAGKGTGLGLAIARGIAEEHGGTVTLQDRPGGGVRVTVRLPLLANPAKTVAVQEEKVV